MPDNHSQASPPETLVEAGGTLEDSQAQVWVRDHSPGIPPEEQPELWNLFHQVPSI